MTCSGLRQSARDDAGGGDAKRRRTPSRLRTPDDPDTHRKKTFSAIWRFRRTHTGNPHPPGGPQLSPLREERQRRADPGLRPGQEACCLANAELGYLDAERARAIEQACDEVAAGGLAGQFPVDALQGGAGTSTEHERQRGPGQPGHRDPGGRRATTPLSTPWSTSISTSPRTTPTPRP